MNMCVWVGKHLLVWRQDVNSWSKGCMSGSREWWEWRRSRCQHGLAAKEFSSSVKWCLSKCISRGVASSKDHFGRNMVYELKLPTWVRVCRLDTHIHSHIIHNDQKMETTHMSIDGWIYTDSGILFSHNEILVHVTMLINIEDIMLSGTGQIKRDKYYTIPLIWGT